MIPSDLPDYDVDKNVLENIDSTELPHENDESRGKKKKLRVSNQ